MYARFTFSLRHLIAKRGTPWNVVESLSPCNKSTRKVPSPPPSPRLSFCKPPTHSNFDLLFNDFIHRRLLAFSNGSSTSFASHELSPNLSHSERPPPPSPPPPHKKYNIFLSFDPTTSPLHPLSVGLAASARLFVCLADL